MSATPAVLPASAAVKPGLVIVQGRVEYRRKSKDGKTVLTLVKLPAPDEYSHPATVEISSPQYIGAQGDEIRVQCRLGGSGRSFDVNDDQGDRITVRTADNRLYLAE